MVKKKKHLRKHIQPSNSDSKLYIYSALGVVGVIVFVSVIKTVVQAASLQFDTPALVSALSQNNVLGDDNEKEEEKQQEEIKKKTEEQRRETLKSSGEVRKTSEPSVKTQININKNETESETTSGKKIKTKVEDNRTTKVEVEHGELKIKYILENGQLEKKIENEDGEEAELNDDEREEVEDETEGELEDEGIEISTKSGTPTVIKNQVSASTEFPLSVDVGTNELTVTTGEGQKTVSVLPDEAVQNLLVTGIMNSVNTDSVNSLTELKVRNSEPVYEIEGEKVFRLFAVIPVSRSVKAVVSAETGDLITQQQSFLTNLIDLLSP